jgi:acyl dehydratase
LEQILVDATKTLFENAFGKKIGQNFGPSEWILVDQKMITTFGMTSLDPDPLHIDPDWAAAHSPYGGTIAFGFLTVALLTKLLHSASSTSVHNDPSANGVFLNYGFDRMRLITPVPVNAHIRGHFVLKSIEPDAKGRTIACFDCKIEIKGHERPALVADWLTIWLPPQ